MLFALFYHHEAGFERVILDAGRQTAGQGEGVRGTGGACRAFRVLWRSGLTTVARVPPHIVACLFQIRRAFYNIFHFILGRRRRPCSCGPPCGSRSSPAISASTRRVLFDRMTDFATLVTGPSGTGKELVARAIGLSRPYSRTPR